MTVRLVRFVLARDGTSVSVNPATVAQTHRDSFVTADGRPTTRIQSAQYVPSIVVVGSHDEVDALLMSAAAAPLGR